MYSVLKGTHDVILDEATKYSYIEELLINTAVLYNYKEFRTPIIENSELFTRSVGEGSDIVRKEMYTFVDKGGRSITLRPEMTAGIARSMVNNKLFSTDDLPVKAFYVGPNFRYERPQQGRYRQFNQFGIECVGVTSIYRDVEVISLGYNALRLLGFEGLTLKINTLGDEETRTNYKNALKEYFSKHLDDMCEDCKDRYEKNILRILDCKVPSDQEIVKKAPSIRDYLTPKAKADFEAILEALNNLDIPYEIDDNLVRGLDYYTGVVFEYHYTSKAGKNYGAVGAGGHYGNLIKEIGGPNVEGVGFAMGIERLVHLMNDEGLFDGINAIKDELDIYVMPLGQEGLKKSNALANSLRLNGFKVDICLESKKMGAMFTKAEHRNARYGIIIGENEVNENKVVLRNLQTKEQIDVKDEDLFEKLCDIFDEDEHHHD